MALHCRSSRRRVGRRVDPGVAIPAGFWGDINGGGMGSVAVNAVARASRLPTRSGAGQPGGQRYAIQSARNRLPPRRSRDRVKAPDLDADSSPQPQCGEEQARRRGIGRPTSSAACSRTLSNQVYSQSGQRMVSPMIGMSGGGGVSIGEQLARSARNSAGLLRPGEE